MTQVVNGFHKGKVMPHSLSIGEVSWLMAGHSCYNNPQIYFSPTVILDITMALQLMINIAYVAYSMSNNIVNKYIFSALIFLIQDTNIIPIIAIINMLKCILYMQVR